MSLHLFGYRCGACNGRWDAERLVSPRMCWRRATMSVDRAGRGPRLADAAVILIEAAVA